MPAGPPSTDWNRVVEDLHKFTGAGQRCARAPFDDECCDPGGEFLLAESAQDIGQAGAVIGVENFGRSQLGVRIHPHIQRRVLGVGETPFRTIQLHRRDAEIEQHTIHRIRCRKAGFGERRRDSVVSRADQIHPFAEGLEPSRRDRQRRGIAVQSDQPQARKLAQESRGMSAGSDGRIDEHGAGSVRATRGQYRGQQFHTAFQQNGNVTVVPARLI